MREETTREFADRRGAGHFLADKLAKYSCRPMVCELNIFDEVINATAEREHEELVRRERVPSWTCADKSSF